MQRYSLCVNGVPNPRQCAPGLWWHVDANWCTFPDVSSFKIFYGNLYNLQSQDTSNFHHCLPLFTVTDSGKNWKCSDLNNLSNFSHLNFSSIFPKIKLINSSKIEFISTLHLILASRMLQQNSHHSTTPNHHSISHNTPFNHHWNNFGTSP